MTAAINMQCAPSCSLWIAAGSATSSDRETEEGDLRELEESSDTRETQ